MWGDGSRALHRPETAGHQLSSGVGRARDAVTGVGAARLDETLEGDLQGDMATSDDVFRAQGTVVETLRNATFRVKLDSGHEVTARASGKMRKGRLIRIIPGDKVELEVSVYDPTKGRIVWRHR
jgi:translation initiation factor IF-1